MQIVSTIRKLCLCCMEEHEVQSVRVQEHMHYLGKSINYIAQYEYCAKAEEYIEEDKMISNNYHAMRAAYKKCS